MTGHLVPSYTARCGEGQIRLRPVYRRTVILWAGFNRQGKEIGILVVQRGRTFWPGIPASGRGKLIRCKFSEKRPHLVRLGATAHQVTNIRRHAMDGYPLTPVCSSEAFMRLRRRARRERSKRPASSLVQWGDLVRPLHGGDQEHYINDDYFCALRAEGWRPLNEMHTLWTFD